MPGGVPPRVWFAAKNLAAFALLHQQAEAVASGAAALRGLFQSFGDESAARAHTAQIREIERRGDELERTIFDRLNKTFLTPAGREDIYAIANKLETILDILEGAADRVELYAISALTPEVLAMADQLATEAGMLVDVLTALSTMRASRVDEAAQRLRTLESEVDRSYREGVARLFRTPGFPPLEVMKLKEILERLEEASDHCEDVANLVEAILIKHG